jgi:hypothetical protein
VKATNKPIASVPPVWVQTQGHSELCACSDKEKAKRFTAHLANVFTPNENHPDQEIEEELSQNILPIKILSPNEIREETGFLNIKKSTGINKITPKRMKELPEKGLVMLTYIFNSKWRLSYWPKQLKTAEIILILKPRKDPKELSSLRPISLLSIVNRSSYYRD